MNTIFNARCSFVYFRAKTESSNIIFYFLQFLIQGKLSLTSPNEGKYRQ